MTRHYVYVLRCADDSLYTGYTTDPERRVAEHDDGDGAKYTRSRTPVELVHVEECPSRSAALSREHEVKSLSKPEKERLVAGRGDADGSDAAEDGRGANVDGGGATPTRSDAGANAGRH